MPTPSPSPTPAADQPQAAAQIRTTVQQEVEDDYGSVDSDAEEEDNSDSGSVPSSPVNSRFARLRGSIRESNRSASAAQESLVRADGLPLPQAAWFRNEVDREALVALKQQPVRVRTAAEG